MHTKQTVVAGSIAALLLPLAAFAQGFSVPGVQFDANGGVNVNVGDIRVDTSAGVANVQVGDIKVKAGAGGATVTVPGVGTIRSSGDVSKYVAVIEKDASVQMATSSTDEISLSYLEPAKLFGFIPMQVPMTATAKSSGDLMVDYPWYGFAVTGKKSDVETKLDENLSATLDKQAGAAFSASIQAYILQAMQAAFTSILGASAK